ncbi:MAG TPA: ATP-binding protein [Synergistaceae bacterium]|nr:ATP-binding protein [Synergistaceae bacterium]
MKSIRRNVIALFLATSLLPLTIVLGVSAAGILAHEQSMRVVARTYVQDLAETVALRYEKDFIMGGASVLTPFFSSLMDPFDRFNLNSFRMPGWVAMINKDGQVLTASPEMEALEDLLPETLPIGSAKEIRGRKGDVFTVAVYPAGKTGWYVLAAVSWEHLLGPMNRFGPLWSFMAIFLGGVSLLGAVLLWKWLVSPLRAMENEMSSLQWGEDAPALCNDTPVDEICRLRSVFFDLAETAIEKRRLMERSVSDMFRIQEAERTHLAREIHDGPLQGVTAFMQQVHLAQREELQGEHDRRLAMAEESARHVVRELRGMCDALSPPWIDLGLSQALTELSERLAVQMEARISLEIEPEREDVPKELVLALFRILQEAVSNAVKHGKAKEIQVKWYSEKGNYIFEVEDNGTGFIPPEDFSKLQYRGHRGLANMAERVKLIRGNFSIQSTIGKGTTLHCVFNPKDWNLLENK